MKQIKKLFALVSLCAVSLGVTLTAHAQQSVNDATAALHMMKPNYVTPYGIPKVYDVKASLDRILNYLDSTTYTELDATGKQLRRGDYRLTSYEWGVTYSAMLRAGELTGDKRYTNYAMKRMLFLVEQAPVFKKWLDCGECIDPLMMQVVKPQALDDCGAICCAMIKAKDKAFANQINTYYDFIANKQYRYKDGQFARMRPVANTVWLDDMFMGIPALAWHGDYAEAKRQFTLFHDKMWVADKHLYRHGWTPQGEVPNGSNSSKDSNGLQNQDTNTQQPSTNTYHPSFFWGRANGWALLTACELLDVKNDPQIMVWFKEHLNGLMPLQDYDGAWHQLLDRNNTYLETSCTAIFCYCLAHAINKKWIEPEPYIGQTLLAWNYVQSHITQDGHVTGTCVGTGLAFDPAFYAYRPVTGYAAHGYGPAIWAGAEIIKLLKSNCIKINDSAVHYYPVDPKTDAPIFYVK